MYPSDGYPPPPPPGYQYKPPQKNNNKNDNSALIGAVILFAFVVFWLAAPFGLFIFMVTIGWWLIPMAIIFGAVWICRDKNNK